MTQRPRILAGTAAALFLSPLAAAAATLPFEFSPSVNLQYEWAQVDADHARTEHDEDFRRARVGFRLKGERWQFVADHDLADNTPPDAFFAFTPAEGHSLRIGQFKQPFSLEDANSDKQTAFLEPSLVGAFAVSRRLGVEYAHQAARSTFSASLFGQRLDGKNDSPGASLRGTWVAHQSDANLVHLGASLSSESPRTDRASFSANPGTTLTDLRLASTGSITGVDRLDRGAVEAMWIHRAWTVQAEAAQVHASRDGAASFSGNASSVLLTWSPSGDARAYKRGVAAAPSAKGHAAWELALRWSAIDLNDGAIAGGSAESYGLAATCYFHRNARVIANVLQADGKRRGVSNEPLVTSLRLQFTY